MLKSLHQTYLSDEPFKRTSILPPTALCSTAFLQPTTLRLLLLSTLIFFINPLLACQSIATVRVTESSSIPALGRTNPLQAHWSTKPDFAVNLTKLLLDHTDVQAIDLQSAIYLGDAEQSRPFRIRRVDSTGATTTHSQGGANHSWYQLTTSVPIDREHICHPRLYPQRVQVAKTCCSAAVDRPIDVGVHSSQGACCAYLDVTVASRGTYFIRVEVVDVNDHAPRFVQTTFGTNHHASGQVDLPTQFRIGLLEDTLPGSWIPLPSALDPDEGLNGFVRYTLESQPSGDSAWKSFFRLVNNLETATLSENSTAAKVVWNREQRRTESQARDHNGPGLIISARLDREKIEQFKFILVASDMGRQVRHTSSLSLQIVILDVNDNPPQFEQSEYNLEVNEEQAGLPLVHIRANDSDAGQNSRITYTMRPTLTGQPVSMEFLRTHIQLIQANDGVQLRLGQPLDYEQQTTFDFDLIASDQGRPILSSTATVHVKIRNVNDHAPTIRFYRHGEPLDRDYARLSVPEQVKSNRAMDSNQLLLCHVHVTDTDSEESNIRCNVESTSTAFVLQEVVVNQMLQRKKIYKLLTTVALDREKAPRHLIMVRCEDGPGPERLVSQKQLQLTVTDQNDHGPIFEQDYYHGTVRENLAHALVLFNPHSGGPTSGKTVILNGIRAQDADIGSNGMIRYHLEPWNVVGRNYRNQSLGILNTTQGQNKSESRVNETISDSEVALDVERFHIDAVSGQLKTRLELDCEVKRLYHFLVVAIDQAEPEGIRFTSSARVTVTVNDENDNPPVLTQRHYVFKLSEGLPCHTGVGQILSTDADISEENRRTRFVLKDIDHINASELLFIEAHTGFIRTRQVLDRELTRQISFVVVAHNTEPARTTTAIQSFQQTNSRTKFSDEASVTVEVLDVNDNAPFMLTKGTKLTDAALEQRLSAVVDLDFRLHASDTANPCVEFPFYFSDADEGQNGVVKVTLEPNPYFEFRLDNTLICQTGTESVPPRKFNLFLTVQDQPEDPSKVLKRRYTVRMRVIQDHLIDTQSALIASRMTELTNTGNHVNHVRKINDSGNQASERLGGDSLQREYVTGSNRQALHQTTQIGSRKRTSSSDGTTITIVAILVAVSGLLCLLLLGVVFALRNMSPTSNRPDRDEKNTDDTKISYPFVDRDMGDMDPDAQCSLSPSMSLHRDTDSTLRSTLKTYSPNTLFHPRLLMSQPHTAQVLYTPCSTISYNNRVPISDSHRLSNRNRMDTFLSTSTTSTVGAQPPVMSIYATNPCDLRPITDTTDPTKTPIFCYPDKLRHDPLRTQESGESECQSGKSKAKNVFSVTGFSTSSSEANPEVNSHLTGLRATVLEGSKPLIQTVTRAHGDGYVRISSPGQAAKLIYLPVTDVTMGLTDHPPRETDKQGDTLDMLSEARSNQSNRPEDKLCGSFV